jgi:hypothetical protein
MSKYSVSFTAGTLLLKESLHIIPLLLNEDEAGIQEEIKTGQLTGINAESSRERKIREIRKRFGKIDKAIWEQFLIVSTIEQSVLLYFSCLKTYQLLQDFHIEVLLDKWSRYDLEVTREDYFTFLFKKSDEHPEVLEWTDSTQSKMISMAKLMLKETGILQNGKIQPLYLSSNFWEVFVKFGELWFLEAMFLSIDEIRNLLDR